VGQKHAQFKQFARRFKTFFSHLVNCLVDRVYWAFPFSKLFIFQVDQQCCFAHLNTASHWLPHVFRSCRSDDHLSENFNNPLFSHQIRHSNKPAEIWFEATSEYIFVKLLASEPQDRNILSIQHKHRISRPYNVYIHTDRSSPRAYAQGGFVQIDMQ